MQRDPNSLDVSADPEVVKVASALEGPPVYLPFARVLDELVAVAKRGQRADSQFFNPDDDWLIGRMRIFQDLPEEEQKRILEEYEQVRREAERANAEGKAAARAGPDAVFRLDTGGLAFFSQLGVARRPDLTQYFIDGFLRNRDAVAFSQENQRLFAEVIPHLTARMTECFTKGETIIQTDRQICDAPGRWFHARQLLFGAKYLQIPYMWRQLTFELPTAERRKNPHIVELSIPHWVEDLGLPEDLVARIKQAGLTQLVLKAPTKGLSLHLGFDYVGEHKMGPLSIAMFLVKQKNGLAIQAALSVARITSLDGRMSNAAIVTIGPSLHGKSTLTIMIDLESSDLADRLGLKRGLNEGVYPMNDDIVLLQSLPEVMEATLSGQRRRLSYGIDGTENNFYAVPFGLTREDDPITYDVLRGTREAPNHRETLENVVVNPEDGSPNFLVNPTRNMRAILSRSRLLARKGAEHLLGIITDGRRKEAVHIPVDDVERVLWQAVMRENTVIPPLRRLDLDQYVRALMYGEAVQMGAAAGAIGKPYREFFFNPFIIGLEDEDPNLLYHILREMERGGRHHEYYIFNTGGVGAESNEEASGPRYKKIPRELTLMLQEALLRRAVKFEYESVLGSQVAVAVVDASGREIADLRDQWLPKVIYDLEEYSRRIIQLRRRRFYGRNAEDKAGILRYTKVTDALLDITNIPTPTDERELAWLLSFYWHVDMAYNTLPELAAHRHEGMRPPSHLLRLLHQIYETTRAQGLELGESSRSALRALGLIRR